MCYTCGCCGEIDPSITKVNLTRAENIRIFHEEDHWFDQHLSNGREVSQEELDRFGCEAYAFFSTIVGEVYIGEQMIPIKSEFPFDWSKKVYVGVDEMKLSEALERYPDYSFSPLYFLDKDIRREPRMLVIVSHEKKAVFLKRSKWVGE